VDCGRIAASYRQQYGSRAGAMSLLSVSYQIRKSAFGFDSITKLVLVCFGDANERVRFYHYIVYMLFW